MSEVETTLSSPHSSNTPVIGSFFVPRPPATNTIKMTEVRVGNFFEHDGRLFNVHEIKVSGIRATYIRSDNNQMHTSLFSYEEIYPVLLTKGWLIKLGFKDVSKKTVTRFYNGKTGMFYVEEVRKGDFFMSGYKNYGWQLKYVHQLQNRYFSLTNSELETDWSLK